MSMGFSSIPIMMKGSKTITKLMNNQKHQAEGLYLHES